MTEIVKVDGGVQGAIQSLNKGEVTVYSSIKGDDFESKKATLNATTNSVAIADNLGKTISLANIIVQAIDMEDEKTGEVSEQPRVILIDDEGNAFHAISQGIFKSLENLLGILGAPDTWPAPVPVQVVEERGRKGYRYYTIRLA